MNFDSFPNASASTSSLSSNNNVNQSFLGSLIETVGDDVINLGSHYAETQLNQWAQHI